MGRVVPTKNSALRHTHAASPLPFAESSLARYSAVVALRANASVSSPLSSALPHAVATACVLWLLLTPADSARLLSRGYEVTSRIPQASPDKNVTFPPALAQVYSCSPWQLWISSCAGDSSGCNRLKLDSCTSSRAFASSFLQIPPRGGHPCSWLMVGACQSPIPDFHRRDDAHAGRTTKAHRQTSGVLQASTRQRSRENLKELPGERAAYISAFSSSKASRSSAARSNWRFFAASFISASRR